METQETFREKSLNESWEKSLNKSGEEFLIESFKEFLWESRVKPITESYEESMKKVPEGGNNENQEKLIYGISLTESWKMFLEETQEKSLRKIQKELRK